MHDWQVNIRALVPRQYRLGLYPKMKNHPLGGWIFIILVNYTFKCNTLRTKKEVHMNLLYN